MKITLTITLFLCFFISRGQWTFEKPISELNYNGNIKIKTQEDFRDGKCHDFINGGVGFENEPLKYTKLYTFNDYYYGSGLNFFENKKGLWIFVFRSINN